MTMENEFKMLTQQNEHTFGSTASSQPPCEIGGFSVDLDVWQLEARL